MKKKYVILGTILLMVACTTACSSKNTVENAGGLEEVVETNSISEAPDENAETDSISEVLAENAELDSISEELVDNTANDNSSRDEEKDMDISEEETMKFDINDIDSFELTSENLTDDVWDDVITNTKVGENLSPELSWEPVEEANYYCVYMFDELIGNWLHWRVEGLTEAGLEAGACDKERANISNDSENEIMAQYIGPYPPGGTHTYTVYVFALKEMPESTELGNFDDSGNNINDIAEILNGDQNNLVGVGKISGKYTAK